METTPFTPPDLPPAKWVTAEALLRLPHGYDKRYELVSGRLLTKPLAGGEHGIITVNLMTQLFAAVEAQKLGMVLAAGTGYCLRRNPDTVYAPDISFVTPKVHIFTSPRQSHVLTAEDTLDGGKVVPGFSCPVATLFE